MKVVNSSNIESIDYNPESKTLSVKFKNGGSYQYHEVSPEAYQGLESAESIGKHLHSHIKPKHRTSKV